MRPILLALALAGSFMAAAQFPYNPLPWKQADFKKIKEKGYTVLRVYQVNGESRDLAYVVEYGAEGLMATNFERGTNDDGDSINKCETVYKYDGKGRLIRETCTDKESGESLTAYTYDAAGRLVKKEVATIDPPTYKYKYNAAGKLAEVFVTQKMAQYDKDGEWRGKTFDKPSDHYVYRYDAKGRLIEEWDFMYDNKTRTPDYKIVWTYNDKGQVVRVKRVNSEGTLMNEETFEYEADGLIRSRTFDGALGEEPIKFEYEYCKGCRQSWMSSD